MQNFPQDSHSLKTEDTFPYIHIYTCACAVCVFMHVCMRIYMYVYIYTYTYIHTHRGVLYIYVCVYKYIYMLTHTSWCIALEGARTRDSPRPKKICIYIYLYIYVCCICTYLPWHCAGSLSLSHKLSFCLSLFWCGVLLVVAEGGEGTRGWHLRERWGAGVEYHFQKINEPYAPS